MNADNGLFISNEFLRAGISSLGAELMSFTDDAGHEYIWQRGPSVWNRSAPLLFPVIGRLRDGMYTHRGAEYRMSRHGFARDSAFTALETRRDAAVFRLSDTPESRMVYPFSFEFTVSYELRGRSLVKEQRVENRSSDTMYYELGGHDGFLLPVDMEHCALGFPGLDKLMLMRGGGEISLADGTLPLDTELFRDGALLMRTPENGVCLSCGAGRSVSLSSAEFPYLALWTPYPAGKRLLCLEPWTAVPDSADAPFELADKPDILSLRPGESRTHRYTITLEETCSEKY